MNPGPDLSPAMREGLLLMLQAGSVTLSGPRSTEPSRQTWRSRDGRTLPRQTLHALVQRRLASPHGESRSLTAAGQKLARQIAADRAASPQPQVRSAA